jgi:hypothetical protein
LLGGDGGFIQINQILINLLRMPDYAAKKLPTAFQMEDLKKPGG